jgi:uncharacterized protein (TIGR02679 family)
MPSAGPDRDRVEAVLGAPELAWLVERLRARIERGRPLTGSVSRRGASVAERAAVARLLGRPVRGGDALTLRLEDLDAEMADAGVAPDLKVAVELLTGPLRDRVSEQTHAQDRVDTTMASLRAAPHAGAGWYEAWIAGLITEGTLTRLERRGDLRLATQAATVLGWLPADGTLALPVLAERALGDTKALSRTPLARLVLRALAIRAGTPPPQALTSERATWASAGVVVDHQASHVHVLNLRCHEDHLIARWLREAAQVGLPFRLTLHQMSAWPLTPTGSDLFVCENPAVLRTASSELDARCAPLVCTEGIPSAACLRLLDASALAGVRIHWHADLDWTGLRTTTEAVRRFGARPWRMTLDAYRVGLARGESEPLRGPSSDSPWDVALAAELRHHGRAVMEERVVADLLSDLRPDITDPGPPVGCPGA